MSCQSRKSIDLGTSGGLNNSMSLPPTLSKDDDFGMPPDMEEKNDNSDFGMPPGIESDEDFGLPPGMDESPSLDNEEVVDAEELKDIVPDFEPPKLEVSHATFEDETSFTPDNVAKKMGAVGELVRRSTVVLTSA